MSIWNSWQLCTQGEVARGWFCPYSMPFHFVGKPVNDSFATFVSVYFWTTPWLWSQIRPFSLLSASIPPRVPAASLVSLASPLFASCVHRYFCDESTLEWLGLAIPSAGVPSGTPFSSRQGFSPAKSNFVCVQPPWWRLFFRLYSCSLLSSSWLEVQSVSLTYLSLRRST